MVTTTTFVIHHGIVSGITHTIQPGKLLKAVPWKLIITLVKLVAFVAVPCALVYSGMFLVRLRRGPNK